MPNGYAVPLLRGISAVTRENPARKLSPLGFLQMVLSSTDGSAELNSNNVNGHSRDLNVKFRRRILESQVKDNANGCSDGITHGYDEFALPALQTRAISLWVPLSQIRQYEQDTSAWVGLGTVANPQGKVTRVMREMYELMVDTGQALLKSINTVLVTQMGTSFGVNTVTANNAARALSFSLGTTGMNDALVQMIADWRENELMDQVMIVGNGPFANYDLIRQILSGQASAQGISQAALANMIPRVWFDKDTRTVWGANHVGVFERGSVHFLHRLANAGNFATDLGNSSFFTMTLPVSEYSSVSVENLDRLTLDVQVKEFDCATDLEINGEVTNTGGPGILITLSKQFTLFTKPTNLYQAADPLFGTNGTLRYNITATP